MFALLKVFPLLDVILICGSNELYMLSSKSSKPLNTESKRTKAEVPIITPIVETKEIIFIARFVLLLKRYRLAIKKGKFILSTIC
jgi:hypothetical protein